MLTQRLMNPLPTMDYYRDSATGRATKTSTNAVPRRRLCNGHNAAVNLPRRIAQSPMGGMERGVFSDSHVCHVNKPMALAIVPSDLCHPPTSPDPVTAESLKNARTNAPRGKRESVDARLNSAAMLAARCR